MCPVIKDVLSWLETGYGFWEHGALAVVMLVNNANKRNSHLSVFSVAFEDDWDMKQLKI